MDNPRSCIGGFIGIECSGVPQSLDPAWVEENAQHWLHLTAFGVGTAAQNPRNIVLLWLWRLATPAAGEPIR